MKIIAILFLFVSSQHLSAQSDGEREVQLAVSRLYEQLSFSDSNFVRVDSIQNLFAPSANIVATFGSNPMGWTVSKYIRAVKENIKLQQISRSVERELFQKIDIFGNIAQVFSTYELTMVIKGNEVVRRGINSIQFIRQNEAWLVASLIWDRENASLKIPPKYLDKQ